jgi:hypothetical protein
VGDLVQGLGAHLDWRLAVWRCWVG